MNLAKLKPRSKTILFKKAIEIPSTPHRIYSTPLPYLDTFARDLARGRLLRPLQNLQRIFLDLGLEPHSLLGVHFFTRHPAEDLVRARISNIFEPIIIFLGPPEFAGRPVATILNELRSGKLDPDDIKSLLIQFDRNILSSTGTPAIPVGTFHSSGEPVEPYTILESLLDLSRHQTPLVETVPIINPRKPFKFRATDRRLRELLERYDLLQRIRARMNFPLAVDLPVERLYPVEKIFHLLIGS